jgi:hypothetical protein
MGKIKEKNLGWIIIQYGDLVRTGWVIMFWPTLVFQHTANCRHKFAFGLSWLNWCVGVVFWKNEEID